MEMTTVISRCKKSDFSAFEKKGARQFVLHWGRQDEVEQVRDESGEPTGEVLETEWCTYESGIFRGFLTTHLLDKVLQGATRYPSLDELIEMYDGLNVDESAQFGLLKEKLKEEVRRYDKSSEVEDFTIGGVHLWLDSTMRSKVRENLETCQQKGEENTTLRFEGMAFPITVTMGWQMYYAVLDYARASWNATEDHLARIDALESLDEVLAYDYRTGYPDKLAF